MSRGVVIWWAGVAAFLALFMLSFSPAGAMIYLWLFPPSKTWHDVLSTLGTMAAAVIALYLGLASNRRTEREKLLVAQLVASEISARLSESFLQLENLEPLFVFAQDDDDFRNNLQTLRRVLMTETFSFKRDTLVALIPLPRQAAHRIARAMDLLKLARRQLDARRTTIEKGSASMVASVHRRMTQLLAQAREELKVATEECTRAAALAVPDIPREEIELEDFESQGN